MFKLTGVLAAVLPLLQLVAGQSQEWGQCGGIGWTGPTTCGKQPQIHVFLVTNVYVQ